ncbi:MAG: dephospho-CoA kinase [Cyanobacteria bacterium J06626_4]
MGQRIIGLTGGIATGKSTVSDYLAEHYQLPILDADVYARQAVEFGTKALVAIAQRYGDEVLNAHGTLNRSHLAQVIFQDPVEKIWVEQQIHPFVQQRFAEEMQLLPSAPTVVQSIPLLFEANFVVQVTEIWVVMASENIQLARLIKRNALSEAAARARINSQWPLSAKVAEADIVLDNNGTMTALYAQVDQALSTS